MSWLTDLLKSYIGIEQARSLRTVPRRKFEYEFLSIDRKTLNPIMWQWQARQFALPLWCDETALTAEASVDDIVINVDTTNRDFVVGGLLVMLLSDTSYEAAEIASFTPTQVTVVMPLLSTWGVNTPVYPLKLSRLKPSQELKSLTTSVLTYNVGFECVEDSVWTASDSVATYRSHPVFEKLHNWKDAKSLTLDRKVAVVDHGTGIVYQDDEADIAIPTESHSMLVIGRVAAANFRSWLYARTGRVVPIWVPTARTDLIMALEIVNPSPVFFVEYIGYTTYFKQERNRRDLRIELWDGTIFYRRVVSSSYAGGAVEALTLDSTLPGTITPQEIKQISFMMFARLNSDDIKLIWKNREVLQVSFKFAGRLDDV